MERRILKLIAQRHKEWHYLTMAFGCNKETAEDIVQNMYIRIHKILQKGTDIMFNKNDVNTYYIIKTLKSIFLDMKRKEKRAKQRKEKKNPIKTTRRVERDGVIRVTQSTGNIETNHYE